MGEQKAIMATATVPPPLRQTANPAPVRAANSVRRTCTIDVSWPTGQTGDRLFIGRVRDYRTPADGGEGQVLDAAEFRAHLAEDKTITAIQAEPAPERLHTLVGVRGGNHLRLFIKDTMPDLIEQAAPIYLPLDDISGTALVSAFAWSQFHDNWVEQLRERFGSEEFEQMMESRVDICWGLKRGNSGVAPEGPPNNPAEADAGDIRNPADPFGWHELPDAEGPGFRRARRIDLTRDEAAGLIRIEAAFQDSAKRRTEGRVAIHEYTISATADLATGTLLSLTPKPHILPFGECPGAVANAQRLVGLPLSDLRDAVIAHLKGTAGCTHLNDALRSMAEVPKLAEYLG